MSKTDLIKKLFKDVGSHLNKTYTLQKKLALALLGVFIPFAIGISIFLAAWFYDQSLGRSLAEMFAAYTVPIIGPLAAVGTGVNAGLHPTIIISWLTVVEVCGALLVWFNYIYLEKIPKLGKLLHQAESASYNYVKQHHWIHKLAILGIIGFIMIPIQGAGPLTAPILARILGMDIKEMLAAVIIAAVIRFGLLASGIGVVI